MKGQSYVFVANHQGAFDIFLIYGFLSRNFKWMMKRQLRQMPFVGKACESAHHIFVDKRGASKIRETYDRARQTLQGGMSLVGVPEGHARSQDTWAYSSAELHARRRHPSCPLCRSPSMARSTSCHALAI